MQNGITIPEISRYKLHLYLWFWRFRAEFWISATQIKSREDQIKTIETIIQLIGDYCPRG